jgi:hypothetical protein
VTPGLHSWPAPLQALALVTSLRLSLRPQGSKVQSTYKKIPGNRYELKVTLKDKVYPKMSYKHQLKNVVVDETPTKIKA